MSDTREPSGTRIPSPAGPMLTLGPSNSAARSIPRNPEPVGGSGGAALAPPEH
jgi:hypothetical protein